MEEKRETPDTNVVIQKQIEKMPSSEPRGSRDKEGYAEWSRMMDKHVRKALNEGYIGAKDQYNKNPIFKYSVKNDPRI